MKIEIEGIGIVEVPDEFGDLDYSAQENYVAQIKEQIKYLNDLVVNWCVEKIIPEVYQYEGYLKQVEYMPVPIELPVNLSSKGTRNLRSVTTTF